MTTKEIEELLEKFGSNSHLILIDYQLVNAVRELLVDRKRLDWLEKNANIQKYPISHVMQINFWFHSIHSTICAAIDAAIEEKKK